MIDKQTLEQELKENCQRLLRKKKLINGDLWLGNPWPIHDYFILFNHQSFVSDEIIDHLSAINIAGVKIEKVKDIGWQCNTITVKLPRQKLKNFLRLSWPGIKRHTSDKYYSIKTKFFTVPLIKIKLYFIRRFGPYFGNNLQHPYMDTQQFYDSELNNIIIYQEKRIKEINIDYIISILKFEESSLRLHFEQAKYRTWVTFDLHPELVIPKDMVNDKGESVVKLSYLENRPYYPITIVYKRKNKIFSLIQAGIVSTIIYCFLAPFLLEPIKKVLYFLIKLIISYG